jgi:hypothetical protein
MATRTPRSWDELRTTLSELFNFKDYYTSRNIDFAGRRITNAGHSKDLDDYVIRRELIDLVGGGISQPPQVNRNGNAKTYEKITFGIGVGSSVSIGTDLTPPYIWSNNNTGRPSIILASANIPPVGADLKIDIKKNGSSIFTLGYFVFPDGTGAKTVISSSGVFTGTVFTRDDVITIDATQIGTTTPGQQITFVIFCKLV